MRTVLILGLMLMASPALGQCAGGVCRKSPQASLPLVQSVPAPLVVGQPVRNVVKVAAVPVRTAVAVTVPPVVNVSRATVQVARVPVKFVRQRKPVRRVLGAVGRFLYRRR